MTLPGATFKWNLYSLPDSFQSGRDEFIVEGFRLRLMGCVLELSFEASGTCPPGSAKALAQRYVEALGKRLLMMPVLLTEEEWLIRTKPPFGGHRTITSNKEDRDRLRKGIEEARDELLGPDNVVLRRCYAHLQKAHEHMNDDTSQTAVSVYKAMEELESVFDDSEKKTIAVLGGEFKLVKRMANESRHRDEKFNQMPRLSKSLLEQATDMIRTYERHLLQFR